MRLKELDSGNLNEVPRELEGTSVAAAASKKAGFAQTGPLAEAWHTRISGDGTATWPCPVGTICKTPGRACSESRPLARMPEVEAATGSGLSG